MWLCHLSLWRNKHLHQSDNAEGTETPQTDGQVKETWSPPFSSRWFPVGVLSNKSHSLSKGICCFLRKMHHRHKALSLYHNFDQKLDEYSTNLQKCPGDPTWNHQSLPQIQMPIYFLILRPFGFNTKCCSTKTLQLWKIPLFQYCNIGSLISKYQRLWYSAQ